MVDFLARRARHGDASRCWIRARVRSSLRGAGRGENIGAVLVTTDAMFTNTRIKLTKLAALYRIPAIYHWREFAAAGGLITYGASLTDANRQVGIYSARILEGGNQPIYLSNNRPSLSW